ncbi:hypothetical protein [Natranaerofaba carboxydovora]|uniref:hypothetical protein n=1 Tax=Natranaerofaba carboxydovora TaxID=2742683 RepID=UPI001F13774C|nr:hypothetical protein [Natranaerofaba carboxydovora]UMZ72526.1 hypothetical protein ACONDI_00046 [Natranaerofaba carboxydovora]
MITIGLDEVGHFNPEISDNNNVNFVAGFIYKGLDYENEKRRIDLFLKNICNEFNIRYPNDLHYDRRKTNRTNVEYFENNIEGHLKDYLRKNGNYHLTCMIKSKEERKDFKNISNLLDDRKANNLYEHMICGLLNNLIFKNLDMENENEVNLEIPTRVSVLSSDDPKINEYFQFGYPYKVNPNGTYRFFSTDQKTFKTALAYQTINSKKSSILKFYNINIQPINYNEASMDMPFLYLADIICNCFKTKFLKYTYQNDYGIKKVHDWAFDFTGDFPYLWAYDDIDSIYNDLLDKFLGKEFISTVETLYKAKDFKSDFTNYYNENWFEEVESKLDHAFDLNKIDVYTSELDNFYKQNVINFDKGLEIFEKLWDMVEKYNDDISNLIKYKIADIGIRANNHTGKSTYNNSFYEIVEELKNEVPIEMYLDTLNRKVQTHANEFDFDKAIELQEYNLECINILNEARKDISKLQEADNIETTRLTARGRALSSLGQMYAFKRMDDALKYFEEALKEFHNDPGNREITISHILNYASDHNNRYLYKKYAKEYYNGASELNDQFNFVLSSKDPFKVYTFFKSINNLYITEISNDFLNKINSVDFDDKGFKVNRHPWELIYKNLGIIFYKINLNKQARKYMKKAVNCVENRNETIEAINYFTKIQNAYYQNNEKEMEVHINEFRDWIKNNEAIYKYFQNAFCEELNKIYFNLCDKFTFTYT